MQQQKICHNKAKILSTPLKLPFGLFMIYSTLVSAYSSVSNYAINRKRRVLRVAFCLRVNLEIFMA